MENNPRFLELKNYYKSKFGIDIVDLESLKSISQSYIKRNEGTVIDAATSALAIGALFHSDTIKTEAITPQMEEAFHLSFPDKEITALSSYSSEELSGIISNWKGKYFEVLLRDELNSGEVIGNIFLEPGQTAQLASNLSQPGWDLQILNSDGTIDQLLQAKATDSFSYIQQALEKYPDIKIISTNEALNHSEMITDHIINSNINDTDLEHQIFEPMSDLFDSSFTDFIESILPGLPFIIIAISETRKVMIGKQSFQVAMSNGFDRALKTGAAIGAGAIVVALDGGLLSIPTAFFTRISIDRIKTNSRTEKAITNRIEIMKNLLPSYV